MFWRYFLMLFILFLGVGTASAPVWGQVESGVNSGIGSTSFGQPAGRTPIMRAPMKAATVGKAVRRPHASGPDRHIPLGERAGDMEAFSLPQMPELPGGSPAAAKSACLGLDTIKSATVVNDRSIRFLLHSGETVQMQLHDRCPGLTYDDAFYYEVTPTRQICERFDSILARSGSRCMIERIATVKTPPHR